MPVLAPVAPAGGDLGPQLPREYGVTRLVLMPRDSEWTFAYWEVAPDTWKEVERRFGPSARASGRAVLRVISGGPVVDLPVRLDARNQYFRRPEEGWNVRAELGLLLPDGRFALLAASPEVRLPEGQVSDVQEERWRVLKGEWERIFVLSGGARLGEGSLDLVRVMEQHWEFVGDVSSQPRLRHRIGSSWPGQRERS